jgi:uncharacterized protein YyaL (SSP411 family)
LLDLMLSPLYSSALQGPSGEHPEDPLFFTLTPDKSYCFVGTYFPQNSTGHQIENVQMRSIWS